jgi:hypothetical protein
MKRSDYLEKRKEIQTECDDKLAALDKVFEMFGGTPIGTSRREDGTSGAGWTFDISKREAVRLALKRMPTGTFSAKDVRAALDPGHSQQITDNQLSAILSNFAAKKHLAIHRKKSGNSPAIYEVRAGQEKAS